MVFVISKYDDFSTSDVISWIRKKGHSVFRINNYEDVAYLFKYHENDLSNSQSDFLKNITGIWFRRCPQYIMQPIKGRVEDGTRTCINLYRKSEQKAAYEYLNLLLDSKRWLNKDETAAPSKIAQLKFADSLGLNIPSYKVVGSKQGMKSFWEKCGRRAVLKPIQDTLQIPTSRGTYIQYTYLLRETDFDDLPDVFVPCMMQEAIEKNIEIRSFFIEGKFYSMGIVSTIDQQTCVDFRRYNDTHPNRRIPYQLPKEIERRLAQLMDLLQINCGSFDLILDNHGKYYFLEVNPVGQFGMVSIPCNYYLEREIALFLIQSQLCLQKSFGDN